MLSPAGRKRVIITNVLPGVDNGQYPAKAIVDQPQLISADIFTDGHDEVAACVLLKHKEDKQWKEMSLTLLNNDHWQLLFEPSKLGTYQFQVLAWIDDYATWRNNVEKKFQANQDIHVELQAGLQIVEDATTRARGKDRLLLLKWIEDYNALTDAAQKISFINNNPILNHLHKCRDKNRTTVHAKTFEITVEPKRALFSTWYELFPRSTSPIPGEHGSFNNVKDLLPRISSMNFDVLYLPPIHPIGLTKRKGKNNSLTATENDPGSPWAIGNSTGGHKAIHQQLGTLKDFKKLIDEAKKQGIEIAMDIAYQCAPDHPYVKEHPAWFKWRADGTVQYAENPPKKYEDIFPFYFESEDWEGLWQELKSIIDYWIKSGITVFRVDNPHTKALPFWEWMIKAVKEEHPEVIFLAEAFTRPRIMEHLAKIGFTQSYTYFTWRTGKREIEEYVTELTHTDLKYYFRPNFWPNTPDILPPYLNNENIHIIRLLLAATLSASYGVYGPVYEYNVSESMPGKEEYNDNEKYEIKHWDWTKYTKTKELMGRVNRIRKENPALQDNIIAFAETTNDQIICYIKYDILKKNIIIVAVNLDPYNMQSASIRFPYNRIEGILNNTYSVHDQLSGDKYQWSNDWNYVSLNPYDMPAHIFKVENN